MVKERIGAQESRLTSAQVQLILNQRCSCCVVKEIDIGFCCDVVVLAGSCCAGDEKLTRQLPLTSAASGGTLSDDVISALIRQGN